MQELLGMNTARYFSVGLFSLLLEPQGPSAPIPALLLFCLFLDIASARGHGLCSCSCNMVPYEHTLSSTSQVSAYDLW